MRITLLALLVSSTWAFRLPVSTTRHCVGPLASAGIESPGLGRPYPSQDKDNNNDKDEKISTTALPSKAGSWKRRETLVAGGALAASFPYVMDLWQFGGVSSLSTEELSVLQEGDAIVRHLWLGRLAYPVLIVALESGLFEALKTRPLTLNELGQRTTPPLPGRSRVMAALVATLTALQLLETDKHDRVGLTPAARGVLLKESPYFWGPQLLAADGTTAVLRRAMHRASKDDDKVVDFASHSTAVIDSFVDSMEAHGAVTAQTTAHALQPFLSPRSKVLDMAGGSGCFARALARTTGASVTLADLPPVVARFRRQSNALPSIPADLFAAWPRGYNVHFLANVLHDWGEAQVCQILAHSRASLDDTNGEAQLIIVEQLLDDPPPLAASLASVSMLLGDWRTGQQYSFAELEQMALAAGFSRVERGPPCGTFYTAVIAHV